MTKDDFGLAVGRFVLGLSSFVYHLPDFAADRFGNGFHFGHKLAKSFRFKRLGAIGHGLVGMSNLRK